MADRSAIQKQIEKLQRQLEEPEQTVTKVVQATVDFANPKSIAAAIKHGFLSADEDDTDDSDEGDEKVDDAPRRRGYFGDK